MSAVQFSVDLDELRSVIASMEAFEARLQGRLSDLDDVIGELHGSWTGAAAAAQKAAHDKLATAAAEVHEAVVEMRQAAEHAHGSYTTAAETNVAMWSQVR